MQKPTIYRDTLLIRIKIKVSKEKKVGLGNNHQTMYLREHAHDHHSY